MQSLKTEVVLQAVSFLIQAVSFLDSGLTKDTTCKRKDRACKRKDTACKRHYLQKTELPRGSGTTPPLYNHKQGYLSWVLSCNQIILLS